MTRTRRRRPNRRRPPGYVLVAVLWTVVAVAACALATAVVGREAVASAANRVALAKAGWRAEDCAARALVAADAALAGTGPRAALPAAAALPGEPPSATAWRTLDIVLRGVSAPSGGCRLAVTPVDTTVRADSTSTPAASAPPASAPPASARLVAPDLWTLTARATEGVPAVIAVLELRVAHAGARPAVVRRRTWVE